MPYPGEDHLLLHQPGARSRRARKCGCERAPQRLDVVRHIDVAKVLTTEILQPRGGDSPRVGEGAQIGARITNHIEA